MLQLRAMHEQVTQMSEQTALLREYVGHTETTAIAAKASADAARDSIELVVNKERARIRIGKPEPLVLTIRIPMSVEFRLFFYGSTPAFNVSSEVITVLSESRDSSQKEFFGHSIHELPKVASASDFTATFNDLLFKPLPLDELTIERIRKGEACVHFSGWIKYLDFFDKPRETAFHYRWNPRDNSANSLRRLIYPEGWEEVGGPKENYYT
jgi:hypothetical protein